MNQIIQAPTLEHDKTMLAEYGEKLTPSDVLERRIVENLIRHLNKNGYTVNSVFDGEEFTSATTAKDVLENLYRAGEISVRVSPIDPTILGDEHGITLVAGNGEEIIVGWAYTNQGRTVFGDVIKAFHAADYV